MAIQSIDTQVADALKQNRIKVRDLTDGQTILTWAQCPEDPSKMALYRGDVVRCDECPNVSTINGGFLNSSEVSWAAILKMAQTVPFATAKTLLEPDEIGCYDADGSGDVLCPECTAKRTAPMAVRS